MTSRIATRIECIRIGIMIDLLRLSNDEATEHLLELWILIDESEVRQNLIGGVSEPHGIDVSCNNERERMSIHILEGGYSCVECVGQSIGEERGELRICHLACRALNILVDNGADEGASSRWRSSLAQDV